MPNPVVEPTTRRRGLAAVLLPAAAMLLAAAPAARDSTTPPGRYVALRGIRMYVEEHGRGRPLVLLHGGAGSGAQFAAQVPFFERRFHVIVPDACAQGRTSDRPGPLTYHEMAEDVVALLDSLAVDRADIVGWSDGGVVGLDLAIHHPGRLRHLVTFGANFRPDGLNPADVAWVDTATVADFGPEMRRFYASVAPDSTHYEAAMAKILELWRTQPRFTTAELGRIRAPALIAAGEHDVVRREHTDALAHAIPGATEWIVPGASHSVLQEQPALANARILAFLEH